MAKCTSFDFSMSAYPLKKNSVCVLWFIVHNMHKHTRLGASDNEEQTCSAHTTFKKHGLDFAGTDVYH